MKDKFGFFIRALFRRTPNKLQNIKQFWVVLMSFKSIKTNLELFRNISFGKTYVMNLIVVSIFRWLH